MESVICRQNSSRELSKFLLSDFQRLRLLQTNILPSKIVDEDDLLLVSLQQVHSAFPQLSDLLLVSDSLIFGRLSHDLKIDVN